MSKAFSKSKRLLVADKCNWHCAYCGEKLSKETMVIDHIVAKSNGGSNHIDNLFPSCRKCNSSKGVKTLEQFRMYLSFKKAIKQPDFNQYQIEFLEKSGVFKTLNIINDHTFFFENLEG
ncbi:hypothetical protein SC936_05715 [Aggregatibacter actinomycetemcomitans serotype e str. SC936]|uniref:HNH endonuclease n=1 Tax=Aggregatibacter actinomycetemcomitans TaxID=714 RepID=UPI00077EA216|nr:HNH endonuclease [Aggregatibacter actinomycetemcomitans]KYK80871.1 hypothetical protein SC936_05715 [Aggregatibacter actinomycetemcomitans serotype e str. SC936]